MCVTPPDDVPKAVKCGHPFCLLKYSQFAGNIWSICFICVHVVHGSSLRVAPTTPHRARVLSTNSTKRSAKIRSRFMEHARPIVPSPNAGNLATTDDDISIADSEDGSVWLDAAWEVAVTVIGAMVIAAGAACGSFIWRRKQQHQRQTKEASAKWPCRPVPHDGPLDVPEEGTADVNMQLKSTNSSR